MSRRFALDMTNGPFLKKMLIFSVPLMITGILQLAYNTADVIVVGKLVGSEALAAVGTTGSLVSLFLNLFMGLSMGAGVMVARHIGAMDEKRIHNCVHTAMLLSIICGVAIGIIGFFLSSEMLILMDVPEDVLPLSTLYLKIYFMGSPGLMVYNFGASIVRSTGNTKRPLFILAVSGIVNVALNLILIIFFGFGVDGVAIATITSQYLSAIMVVIFLMRQDNACQLFLRDLRIYAEELKSILKLGVPAGLQNCLFSVSNVIIQSSVNSFGSVVMAGTAAASNFDSYIYTMTNAISQTTMTFTSQNIGAKKYSNMNIVYRECLLLTIGIGVVMGAVGYIFAPQIVSLFSSEADVIAIGADRLKLIMPFYVFCSLMDVAGGQVRGMGRSVQPMLVALLGGCGIRILWVFAILPLNNTLTNLYMAYPVSWTITALIQFALFFIVKHSMKKKGEWQDTALQAA